MSTRHRRSRLLRALSLVAVLLPPGQALAAPAAATWTTDSFLEVARVSDAVPSPDGARVAYVVARADLDRSPSAYAGQLFVASESAAPRQYTFSQGSVSRPRWSPDGAAIAFLAHPPGGGAGTLMVIPADGGAPRPLTGPEHPVEAFQWSPKGGRLALLQGPALGDGPETARVAGAAADNRHLWLLTLSADGRAADLRQLTRGDFNVGNPLLGEAFDFSPDGRSIAFTRTRGAALDDWRSADLALVDVGDGTVRSFRQSDAAEFAPVFSPDGRHIAFNVSVYPPSWIAQSRIGVARTGGEGLKLLAATADEQPRTVGWISNRTLLVKERAGTVTALWTLPLDGGPPRRFDDGDGVLDSVSLNAPGTRLGLVVSDGRTAPEAAVTDLRRYRPRTISRANTGLAALPAASTRRIEWAGADGTAIEGLLTLPPGHRDGQQHPLILVLHGGPADAFDDHYLGEFHGVPLADLAAAGYLLLRANPRGSGGYGHPFRDAIREDWGGADVDDVLSGVDHVIASGLADPQRLGLVGWSYGGYLGARIISRTHRFGAAALGAPVTHLSHMAVTTDIPGFVADYLGGEFWQVPGRYAERSPLLAAGDITTPALILHGEKDPRVPADQGLALYRALERQGLDTRLVTYPRAGHRLTEPRQMQHAANEILTWFKGHVPVR